MGKIFSKKETVKKEDAVEKQKDEIISVNFKPSEKPILAALNNVSDLNDRPRARQIKLYIKEGLKREE